MDSSIDGRCKFNLAHQDLHLTDASALLIILLFYSQAPSLVWQAPSLV